MTLVERIRKWLDVPNKAELIAVQETVRSESTMLHGRMTSIEVKLDSRMSAERVAERAASETMVAVMKVLDEMYKFKELVKEAGVQLEALKDEDKDDGDVSVEGIVCW